MPLAAASPPFNSTGGGSKTPVRTHVPITGVRRGLVTRPRPPNHGGATERRPPRRPHCSALPFSSVALSEPSIAAAASTLFSAATVYTVCVYGVTLASTARARALHATRAATAPLIGLWAVAVALVAASGPATAAVRAAFEAGWTAATAPPGVATPGWLPAFAAAFAHPAVAAAAWAHLLAIDLVQARWILLDGAAAGGGGGGVPTRHSLALTLMAGPLGLVCHVLTRWVWHHRARARARAGA